VLGEPTWSGPAATARSSAGSEAADSNSPRRHVPSLAARTTPPLPPLLNRSSPVELVQYHLGPLDDLPHHDGVRAGPLRNRDSVL